MENKNLIKVLNQDKAQELISLGFNHVKETVGENVTYCFFIAEELRKYMNSNKKKKGLEGSKKVTF